MGISRSLVTLEALNRRSVSGVTPGDLAPLHFYRAGDIVRSAHNAPRSTRHGQTRSPSRHARPPDPQGRFAQAGAWVGDFRAYPSGLARHAPDSAGLALPSPPSPRAARVDQGDVGRVGE